MIGFYLILVCTIGWYEKFNKWRKHEMEDKRHYEQEPIMDLQELIMDLIDNDECQFDFHGNCQQHGWTGERECPHSRAKKFLKAYSKVYSEKKNYGEKMVEKIEEYRKHLDNVEKKLKKTQPYLFHKEI